MPSFKNSPQCLLRSFPVGIIFLTFPQSILSHLLSFTAGLYSFLLPKAFLKTYASIFLPPDPISTRLANFRVSLPNLIIILLFIFTLTLKLLGPSPGPAQTLVKGLSCSLMSSLSNLRDICAHSRSTQDAESRRFVSYDEIGLTGQHTQRPGFLLYL